jgi:hypothetical protein
LNARLRLQPLLEREEARQRLAWRRWLPPRSESGAGRLELVELPCFVFEARVRTGGGTGPAFCVVDAVLGQAAVLEAEGVAALEAARSRDRGHGGGEGLPAELPEEACRGAAEDFLRRRLALLNRNRDWALEQIVAVEAAAYPYWLRYYRRRGGWQVEALDAIGGARVGGALKRSLVAGVVAVESNRGDPVHRG